MVEFQSPERKVGFRSSFRMPCCILEQDTFTSQKVLVVPRKQWLCPDMTEKLLTGTQSINLNKTKPASIKSADQKQPRNSGDTIFPLQVYVGILEYPFLEMGVFLVYGGIF